MDDGVESCCSSLPDWLLFINICWLALVVDEFWAGVQALLSDEGEGVARASFARRLPRTDGFLPGALEGVRL